MVNIKLNLVWTKFFLNFEKNFSGKTNTVGTAYMELSRIANKELMRDFFRAD